jgi:hypothetical protein
MIGRDLDESLPAAAFKSFRFEADAALMSANRLWLVVSLLFVPLAIGGALYLQPGGGSASPLTDPAGNSNSVSSTPDVSSTPESRYLSRLASINSAEQSAWLAAFNGQENVNESAYDQSWVVAHTAAVNGTPIVRHAVRQLARLKAPKVFRHPQSLLLQKYRLQLTLIGLIQQMSAKRDASIFALIGPIGRAGDAHRALTPRIKAAFQAAASKAGVSLPASVATTR